MDSKITNHSNLPTLPISTLEDSTQHYLRWLHPLLPQETQFQRSEQITKDFIDGDGKILQTELQNFAATQFNESWLNAVWFDKYLKERQPLPLKSSVGFAAYFAAHTTPDKQIEQVIVAFAQLCAQVIKGVLPPQFSPRGYALDMRQWQILQGAARIAKKDKDDYYICQQKEGRRYALISYRGRSYRLPVLDENKNPYSVSTIRKALKKLYKSVENEKNNPVAGAESITFGGQEAAFAFIQNTQKDPQNSENYAKINNALFQIRIDDHPPKDKVSGLREAWLVPNTDIWAYKPLTILCNLRDNSMFFHFEHAFMDASCFRSMVTYIEGLYRCEIKPLVETSQESEIEQHVELLTWNFNSAQRAFLQNVHENYFEETKKLELFIANVSCAAQSIPPKISRDSIMQLILQYAYWQTFGDVANTHQAIDMSHFREGRSEYLHCVSDQSLRLIKMLSFERADRQMLEDALIEHKKRIKECKLGLGVNRHLLGLSLMAEKHGIATLFFNDPNYHLFNCDTLSTSSVGTKSILGEFAFATEVTGGLGVSYMNTEDGFCFAISICAYKKGECKRFARYLQEGCNRIIALLAS